MKMKLLIALIAFGAINNAMGCSSVSHSVETEYEGRVVKQCGYDKELLEESRQAFRTACSESGGYIEEKTYCHFPVMLNIEITGMEEKCSQIQAKMGEFSDLEISVLDYGYCDLGMDPKS
ncbi:MAG: hypothetical protein LBB23_00750 [Rickettsiales bacterium]|jgi:hypothetical protein|nr:hypothetical protein [Rickettsiales bacterium]